MTEENAILVEDELSDLSRRSVPENVYHEREPVAVDISEERITCSSKCRKSHLQLVVEPDNDEIDQDTIHIVMSGLTVEQVLQDCDSQLWREAIISKVESSNSYRMFCRVEKVTDKIIPTKFVLMRKLNKKGNLERYKARLVA